MVARPLRRYYHWMDDAMTQTFSERNEPMLFDRFGVEYAGRHSADEKGKPFHTRERSCGRCGGAGGSDKWAHTGWTCYECGGVGYRGTETIKLYTREQLDKLNAAQTKRTAKRLAVAEAKAAEQRAAADFVRADFEAIHGEILARAEQYAERSDFIADVTAKARGYCSMSDGQAKALRAAVERIEAADWAKAASRHIGKIGERFTASVVVERVADYSRPKFGATWINETVWIVTMRDGDNCAIVSKSPSFHAKRGDRLTIAATVKEHAEFRDEQQTIVQRITIKERIAA
jgi:hypothetical protein